MYCPKCKGVELKKIVFDGMELDECPECKGIWFDFEELDVILESEGVEAIEGEDEVWHEADDSKDGHCPKCGGDGNMVPVHNVEHGIHIDTCTVCYGKWLDGGELKIMREKGVFDSIRSFIASIYK
ncbi:MAG: zf-TFIIB domain-containing protein [Planctomycetes bacterium]|nr:zf-TFIIB domain-containing protein [Planctomycetota bacterium]